MHIADGILPVAWCAAAHAVAAPAVYWCGRRLTPDAIVRAGLVSSALFAVSLVHIPLGATSVHLSMLGLAGVLLGGAAPVSLFAALLLQAILFQHGGIVTLGINVCNLGAGALAAAWIWRTPLPVAWRGFLAGFVAVMTPAVLIGVQFAAAGYGKGFLAIAGLYVVVAAAEGLITSGMVTFLARAKPALLPHYAG
jgi:cobalt/nickel transport system permease protein